MESMAFVKLHCNGFYPQPKPTPKVKSKPKKIKAVSDKRNDENKIYSTLREVFLKDKKCQCNCNNPATDVHHKKGRVGKLLCDIRFWLAACRECHDKVERNPMWAKSMGYSIDRLST